MLHSFLVLMLAISHCLQPSGASTRWPALFRETPTAGGAVVAPELCCPELDDDDEDRVAGALEAAVA